MLANVTTILESSMGAVFDSDLKLLKPTFIFAHIDLIVVLAKIHLATAQEFPMARRLGCPSHCGKMPRRPGIQIWQSKWTN